VDEGVRIFLFNKLNFEEKKPDHVSKTLEPGDGPPKRLSYVALDRRTTAGPVICGNDRVPKNCSVKNKPGQAERVQRLGLLNVANVRKSTPYTVKPNHGNCQVKYSENSFTD
jgi:hypothetical protein